MKSRKNSDSKTNQKRLFMRMKSPTAFGSARRFDSASFMNVPPEMARRDAAYHCFSAFFRNADLSRKKRAERCLIYDRILKLLAVIEEKSEFILNSDIIEKRNLENADSLAFVRLLRKYFTILSNLASACNRDAAKAQMVIDKLPEIARSVAEPIGAIKDVRIYGGSGEGIAQLSGQVPTVIKQTMDTVADATGVDMTEIVKQSTLENAVKRTSGK